MKKQSKTLCLVFVAALASLALAAATASATTLEIGGVAQNKSVSITVSLKSGTSGILRDTNNLTVDTCTQMEAKGATEGTFSGVKVSGKASTWSFGGCSHKTTVLAPGTISVTWTSGTNGSVTSSGAEVTVVSTVFGASCIAKTGEGTNVGTFTGTKEGTATMDVNGVIPMGLCGDAVLTGTGTVTSPLGLGVVN